MSSSDTLRLIISSAVAFVAFIFISIIPCIPITKGASSVTDYYPVATVYIEFESGPFQKAVILSHMIASVLIGFAVWRLKAPPVRNATQGEDTSFDEM